MAGKHRRPSAAQRGISRVAVRTAGVVVGSLTLVGGVSGIAGASTLPGVGDNSGGDVVGTVVNLGTGAIPDLGGGIMGQPGQTGATFPQNLGNLAKLLPSLGAGDVTGVLGNLPLP